MDKPPIKRFKALLEKSGDGLRWVVARIPFDVKKEWPVRNGRRIRGEINGFAFRTALFPSSGEDGGHVLLVNKTMQAGARARVGDQVRIQLEPDMEERDSTLPAELVRALKSDRALQKWFESLKPSLRRDLGRWVAQPKTAASRNRRAEQCAEWLLLTMDGENATPPILRAAFAGYPGAAAGWEAMTPVRRRNHLLSVFHYQTPEARSRRVQAVIEDALKMTRKAR